jgi:hypothetical protein
MFDATQNKELNAPLNRSHVKSRSQGGRQVSYIEGWHVIAEANRIFGFDAWSRETIDVKCVSEREREIGPSKQPGWAVTYICRVRIKVGDVIRDGKLKRCPCTICGTTKHVHAHHKDYSKPLDVTWLCARCHHRLHSAFPELGGHAEKSA